MTATEPSGSGPDRPRSKKKKDGRHERARSEEAPTREGASFRTPRTVKNDDAGFEIAGEKKTKKNEARKAKKAKEAKEAETKAKRAEMKAKKAEKTTRRRDPPTPTPVGIITRWEITTEDGTITDPSYIDRDSLLLAAFQAYHREAAAADPEGANYVQVGVGKCGPGTEAFVTGGAIQHCLREKANAAGDPRYATLNNITVEVEVEGTSEKQKRLVTVTVDLEVQTRAREQFQNQSARRAELRAKQKVRKASDGIGARTVDIRNVPKQVGGKEAPEKIHSAISAWMRGKYGGEFITEDRWAWTDKSRHDTNNLVVSLTFVHKHEAELVTSLMGGQRKVLFFLDVQLNATSRAHEDRWLRWNERRAAAEAEKLARDQAKEAAKEAARREKEAQDTFLREQAALPVHPGGIGEGPSGPVFIQQTSSPNGYLRAAQSSARTPQGSRGGHSAPPAWSGGPTPPPQHLAGPPPTSGMGGGGYAPHPMAQELQALKEEMQAQQRRFEEQQREQRETNALLKKLMEENAALREAARQPETTLITAMQAMEQRIEELVRTTRGKLNEALSSTKRQVDTAPSTALVVAVTQSEETSDEDTLRASQKRPASPSRVHYAESVQEQTAPAQKQKAAKTSEATVMDLEPQQEGTLAVPTTSPPPTSTLSTHHTAADDTEPADGRGNK